MGENALENAGIDGCDCIFHQDRADVNAIASIDEDGFGGQTRLFGTVVSQPYSNGRQGDGAMAEWLLKQGADPKRRASIRKGIGFRLVEDLLSQN